MCLQFTMAPGMGYLIKVFILGFLFHLQVKRLTELAVMPVRGSEGAAGFDLASAYDVVIPAGGKGLVKTDLAIAIPMNTYARIAPRYVMTEEEQLLYNCSARKLNHSSILR